MTREELHYTLTAMRMFGGGFYQALAAAWMCADQYNAGKLADAFPAPLVEYGPGSPFFERVKEAA